MNRILSAYTDASTSGTVLVYFGYFKCVINQIKEAKTFQWAVLCHRTY